VSESLIAFKSTTDNRRRRSRTVAWAGLALVVAGLAVATPRGADASPDGAAPMPPVVAAAVSAPERTTVARVRFPAVGSRLFRMVPGRSDYIGTRGKLRRFRVLVERDIANVDPVAVGAFIEQTLNDPRGWTAGGKWRFRRVGPGEPFHFTIYLATPATRDALCNMGYDRYTSCRNGKRVVINVARWARGVPHYRAPLDTYRQYVINHEVGHFLGRGHERCPGRGRPAPVMLQQTFGLHGCVANAWPFVNGRRYRGPAGAYY
jgi:hypothetical protein